MKGYLLRQVSLDKALSESITRRDFDWDADMRRMMNTVKVSLNQELTAWPSPLKKRLLESTLPQSECK